MKSNNLIFIALAINLIFCSCDLTQKNKVENTLSFTKSFNELSQYDSVVIEIKSTDGNILDTVYKKRVETLSQIQNLEVKNWDGGKIAINLYGFKDTTLVYQVNKNFDGKSNKTESNKLILSPEMRLTTLDSSLSLKLGEALALPEIIVLPENLNNKALIWTVSKSNILEIKNNQIIPKQVGSTEIAATFSVATTKSLKINISVEDSTTIPYIPKALKKLMIMSDTLKLLTRGPGGRVLVEAEPAEASNLVTWFVDNLGIATVTTEGLVSGIKAGSTILRAISKENPSITDTAIIKVTDPIVITAIQFRKTALEIYVGASIALEVEAYPTREIIDVDFKVSDGTKATITDGKLSGLVEGTVSVIAISKEFPALKDTLGVTVVKKLANVLTVNITSPKNNSYSLVPKIKVEWTVNGSPQTTDTIQSLLEGRNSIVRTAKDADGNSYSDNIFVILDTEPPATPIILGSSPITTASPMPTWSWTSGGNGGIGSYRFVLDLENFSTINEVKAESFKPLSALKDGPHTLFIQERDAAGNWSAKSAAQTFIVDTSPPDAVTFIGIDNSFTASQTPTWSWSPSPTNGGINAYILKLDAEPEFELASTTYTPTSILSDNQSHTLVVKQKDQVAGVVGASKSFTFKVRSKAGGAPVVVSASGVANNGITNNPKFTWTPGGNGNGIYRVRLNNEVGYQTHPQPAGTQTDWTLPASAADGIYTLHVSEQDILGRWSGEGEFTIQLDRTGPAITLITTDKITNKPTISLSYSYSGNPSPLTVTCNLSDLVETPCKLSAKDALGNETILTVPIWRRSDVIFIKPNGIGDGSSWDKAAGNLLVHVNDSLNKNKEIWIGSGDFSAFKSLNPANGMKIYGGFNPSLYPVNTATRVKFQTILSEVQINIAGQGLLDGVLLNGELISIWKGQYTVTDCKLQRKGTSSNYGVNVSSGTSITLNNVIITGVMDSDGGAVHVKPGGIMTINGGSIFANFSYYEFAINVEGTVNLKGDLSVYGNTFSPPITSGAISFYDGQVGVFPGGTLTVDTSVSLLESDIKKFGGKITYKGKSL